MAKALFGHVGMNEMSMATQIKALRTRVGELEATVLRLRAENDRLTADAHEGTLLTVGAIVDDREHAYS